MSTHKRLFPTMSQEQCAALSRLCSLRQPKTLMALQLYAIDGLDPKAIAQRLDLAPQNVHRTIKKAQGYLKLSRQALGIP